MKINVRSADLDDLDRIVLLHMESYDENELSVVLGRGFVRAFYRLCITDPQVRVRVVDSGGNSVVGLSVVFFNYSVFEARYKAKALPLFALSAAGMLLRFRLSRLVHTFKSICSRGLKEHLDCPARYDSYVGSFILDAKFKDQPAIVVAFIKMVADNVRQLSKTAKAGIWGSCRESNQASLRILKDRGMKNVVKVKAFPEDIFLCMSKPAPGRD